MKEKIFIIVLIFTIVSGCKKNSNAPKPLDENNVEQLNDTVSALIKKHAQGKDSLALNMALLYTDQILTIDTVKANEFKNYSTKIQILEMMGRAREAFFLRTKILPKDPNNFDRLMYNAISEKVAGKADLSDNYFNRAMQICDSILSKKDSTDIIVHKIMIYTYKGENDNAKKFLDEILKKEPNNMILNQLKNNYDKQSNEVNAWLQKLK